MGEMRLCRVCATEKPIEAFPVYNRQGFRRHECGACMRGRHLKYQGDDWLGKPSAARPSTSIKRIYAGKNHCWVCRKPVKESGDVVLCKVCNGATNGQ